MPPEAAAAAETLCGIIWSSPVKPNAAPFTTLRRQSAAEGLAPKKNKKKSLGTISREQAESAQRASHLDRRTGGR